MPHRLKRCSKCLKYTISEDKCPICGNPLINVEPPRFSLQDKYQEYRMPYFREKMQKKFPELAEKIQKQ
ncbi:MAG: nucleolar RNA-binding Nop10p family protein [Promethearchaeota archaeon]